MAQKRRPKGVPPVRTSPPRKGDMLKRIAAATKIVNKKPSIPKGR